MNWNDLAPTDNLETPPTLFAALHQEFNFTVDLTADATNHLLPTWFGPGGEVEDGLSVPWGTHRGYAFPPTIHLIGAVARKAVQEPDATVVMLLPFLPAESWFATHIFSQTSEVRFLKYAPFLHFQKTPVDGVPMLVPFLLVVYWRNRRQYPSLTVYDAH